CRGYSGDPDQRVFSGRSALASFRTYSRWALSKSDATSKTYVVAAYMAGHGGDGGDAKNIGHVRHGKHRRGLDPGLGVQGQLLTVLHGGDQLLTERLGKSRH